MVEARLREMGTSVDARLAELLPDSTTEPVLLHEAMRYSCLAPGKRLRPVLALAAAELIGADPYCVIDAACALEMIHCFSLIHDDLPCIDNDDLRRGLPTCHKKFGEAVALLAGDALFALAFEKIASSPFPADRVVESIYRVSKASGSGGLVGGETADILAEGRPSSAAEVEFIHMRKTASLIAVSLEIGALLVGGTPEQVKCLGEYGTAMGLSFQVADDILNETGSAEMLGKATGSDSDRQKATYPAVYGLEQSQKEAERLCAKAQHILLSQFPKAIFLRDLSEYVISRST